MGIFHRRRSAWKTSFREGEGRDGSTGAPGRCLRAAEDSSRLGSKVSKTFYARRERCGNSRLEYLIAKGRPPRREGAPESGLRPRRTQSISKVFQIENNGFEKRKILDKVMNAGAPGVVLHLRGQGLGGVRRAPILHTTEKGEVPGKKRARSLLLRHLDLCDWAQETKSRYSPSLKEPSPKCKDC